MFLPISRPISFLLSIDKAKKMEANTLMVEEGKDAQTLLPSLTPAQSRPGQDRPKQALTNYGQEFVYPKMSGAQHLLLVLEKWVCLVFG